MPKTPKLEYDKRLFTVQEWIIEGLQPAIIIRQICENGWGGKRQAERMLQQAREMWIDIPEANIEEKRKLKIAELQELRRSLKTVYEGTPLGIRTLLEIDKQIIMLEGLNPAQQHVVKGDKDSPIITEVKHTVTFRNYGQGN